MIKQIFHLIWNTRRKNILLSIEILVSFLVLFGVYTFLLTGFSIYSVPSGFAVEDTYTVSLPFPEEADSSRRVQVKRQVVNELMNNPGVVEASYSNFAVPYNSGGWSSNTFVDGKEAHSFFVVADDKFDKVHQLQLVQGRWFEASDAVRRIPPVVINQLYVDKYLEDREALGTMIQVDGAEREVVGVISHYKYRSDFLSESPVTVMFEPAFTAKSGFLNINVKPGTPATFELELSDILEGTGYLTGFQILKTESKRPVVNRFFMIPMYIFVFLCVFLILNVALGLFGVVWYNINKRTSEIGLRRAVGATNQMIYLQLAGEQLAIATISLLVGLIIAVQFPILKVFYLDASLYIKGMILAMVTVLVVILICSLLPGRKASKIHPAIALHEE